MCLAAFAINASARWPLVIASNRDEFFDRPALPLASWQSSTGQTIISGRDERAGGTWLGITHGGRVALLTNVREHKPPPAPRTRGELPMRWLQSDGDAHHFMAQTDAAAYGGFNLVLGDLQSGAWTWLSNRPGCGLFSQALKNGVYGLSNAALDSPWPKTRALKAAMQAALTTESETPLWDALADGTRANPQDLPHTGLPLALESELSSAFVDLPERGYGTRCSTVLVAMAADNSALWHIQITENTHQPGHEPPQISPQISQQIPQQQQVAFDWRKNDLPA